MDNKETQKQKTVLKIGVKLSKSEKKIQDQLKKVIWWITKREGLEKSEDVYISVVEVKNEERNEIESREVVIVYT